MGGGETQNLYILLNVVNKSTQSWGKGDSFGGGENSRSVIVLPENEIMRRRRFNVRQNNTLS